MSDSSNPFATINSTNIPQNLLSYDGKLGRIYGISIKNFFLCIITLGIYSAWATNNMRKYTFGSFSIASDRLEYSGKGGQLFKGFIIIAILYLLLLVTALEFATSIFFPEEYEEIFRAVEMATKQDATIAETAAPANPEILAVTDANGHFNIDGCLAMHSAEKCEELYGAYLSQPAPTVIAELEEYSISGGAYSIRVAQGLLFQGLLLIFAYLTFRFFAKFSTARYRLSCAKWRGIGGGIGGVSTLGYIVLRFKRLFLNIITLGYLIGRGDLLAEKYILDNAYIGKTKFNFAPDFKSLDKINLITLLLAIPTIGISRLWYRAALLNYKYKNLSLAGIKFESSFTGGKLLWLYATNLVIIICTLLIGKPITTQRSLKFFAENLRVMGNVESLNFIQQSAQSETLGEGINQVFGVGETGVDFGVI